MNIEEIAAKLVTMRETQMTAFIMSGQLREELGFEGYGEALRRRWIQADEEMSGMVQITNNLGVIAEMRALAEEFKTKCKCKCKGETCQCGCKDGKCTCPDGSEPMRESALISVAHANRTKATLAEIATYGLGRQPDTAGTPIVGLGAQSAQPATPAASPAPIQSPNPATPNSPQTMGIGADVRVVEAGKTYVGKVSQVKPDGKMQISFGGDKPATVRDYDKSEVSPADATKQ